MGRDYLGAFPIVAGMGFSRDVLLLDDCEGTMTYVVSGTGGDDVHTYDAAAAYTGLYGLRLKTRTTSAAVNDTVTIAKYFDFPESGLLIARLRFCYPAVAAVTGLAVELKCDNDLRQYSGGLFLTPGTPDAQILIDGPAYVTLALGAAAPLGGAWYTLELAIDCTALKFVHARLNGQYQDLSSYALYNAAAASGRLAWLLLTLTASAGAPAEIYLDNIVVHQIPEA